MHKVRRFYASAENTIHRWPELGYRDFICNPLRESGSKLTESSKLMFTDAYTVAPTLMLKEMRNLEKDIINMYGIKT